MRNSLIKYSFYVFAAFLALYVLLYSTKARISYAQSAQDSTRLLYDSGIEYIIGFPAGAGVVDSTPISVVNYKKAYIQLHGELGKAAGGSVGDVTDYALENNAYVSALVSNTSRTINYPAYWATTGLTSTTGTTVITTMTSRSAFVIDVDGWKFLKLKWVGAAGTLATTATVRLTD